MEVKTFEKIKKSSKNTIVEEIRNFMENYKDKGRDYYLRFYLEFTTKFLNDRKMVFPLLMNNSEIDEQIISLIKTNSEEHEFPDFFKYFISKFDQTKSFSNDFLFQDQKIKQILCLLQEDLRNTYVDFKEKYKNIPEIKTTSNENSQNESNNYSKPLKMKIKSQIEIKSSEIFKKYQKLQIDCIRSSNYLTANRNLIIKQIVHKHKDETNKQYYQNALNKYRKLQYRKTKAHMIRKGVSQVKKTFESEESLYQIL